MNTAVIGLGSNIDPQRNIEAARQLLRSQFTILQETDFIKNPPCGSNPNQPEFINGAILVKTLLSQVELKAFLKKLEMQLGRTPEMKGQAPRIIDLDIHVWNQEVVDPYFYTWPFIRRFVLELVPDLNYDKAQVKGS